MGAVYFISKSKGAMNPKRLTTTDLNNRIEYSSKISFLYIEILRKIFCSFTFKKVIFLKILFRYNLKPYKKKSVFKNYQRF